MRCYDESVISWAVNNGRLIAMDEDVNDGEMAVAILTCECPGNEKDFRVLADLDEQVKDSINELQSACIMNMRQSNNLKDYEFRAVSERGLVKAGADTTPENTDWAHLCSMY